MENKLLGMFSISRKAGKLVCGFDSVKEQLLKSPFTVYLAADVSPKTEKEIGFLCEKSGTMVKKTPLTMYQISGITGRLNGVMCVTDKNLSEKIDSIIEL